MPNAQQNILNHYPLGSDSAAKQSWIDFSTDTMFTAPMRTWADKMSNVSSNAYLYWWNWNPSVQGSQNLKAFHSAEIAYIFGELSNFRFDLSPEDEAFSELMMDVWSNFAKTGNPSVPGIIDWPAYAEDRGEYVVLGPKIEKGVSIRDEKIQLIRKAYEHQREGAADASKIASALFQDSDFMGIECPLRIAVIHSRFLRQCIVLGVAF